MAKCIYCKERAGLWAKICPDCKKLLECFEAVRGRVGYGEFLNELERTGVAKEKIPVFLTANPYGAGSVQDQITAEMASELMNVMGLKGRQTAEDVKRVREMSENSKLKIKN